MMSDSSLSNKFSSEYKTHFTWHDSSYHAPIQDGIKKQTELTLSQPQSIHEPALSRKKKYPDLAYKSHQVIRMVKSDGLDSLETLAVTNRDDRARSEERNKNHHGSIRSRSVEPYVGRRHYPIMMTQSFPPVGYTPTPKISEYRSQFAWPPGTTVVNYAKDSPRKSISMGAIQATQDGITGHHQLPNGHVEDGERSPVQDDSGMKALEEQIIEDTFNETLGKPKDFKTEYKARFKPPSKHTRFDGSRMKAKDAQQLDAPAPTEDGKWFEALIESRRKAGEYKIRALGTGLAPEHLSPVYLSHQEELWKQVAQRESLSALALAAVPRKKDETKGKAQKEKENFRQAQQRKQVTKPKCRSAIAASTAARSQTQPERKPRPPSHVIPRLDGGRGRESTRHHLQRTTPASDGSLLTSPTRDKLEPVAVHKEARKIDAAPAKSKSGAHSPKYGTAARAQSAAPPSARPQAAAMPDIKRQRPTSLSSTTKSKQEKSPADDSAVVKIHTSARPSAKMTDKILEKGQEEEALIEQNGIESKKEGIQSPPPLIPINGKIEMVPLVKSPPEPTRVKSPEQISVKSPEPVKWTIPLDTGIKWTDNLIIDDDPLKSDESKLGINYHPPITDTVSLSKQTPSSISNEGRQDQSQPCVHSLPSSGRSLATDTLEMARTRFDQFWGKGKDK